MRERRWGMASLGCRWTARQVDLRGKDVASHRSDRQVSIDRGLFFRSAVMDNISRNRIFTKPNIGGSKLLISRSSTLLSTRLNVKPGVSQISMNQAKIQNLTPR